MAETIKLVQGDTRPQLELAFTDENDDDAVVPITGGTVRMYFRLAGTETVLSTLTGAVTDGPNGIAVIPWSPGSLDVDAGDYEGEVEVTFSDTTIQTVYRLLKFRVRADF